MLDQDLEAWKRWFKAFSTTSDARVFSMPATGWVSRSQAEPIRSPCCESCWSCAPELGVVLSVVHFNHNLRGEEADADEQFVAQLAQRHKLELHCRYAAMSRPMPAASTSAPRLPPASFATSISGSCWRRRS